MKEPGTTLAYGCRSMCVNNVVSLQVVRDQKKAEQGDPAYKDQVCGMEKLALLEEMMRFQEERALRGHLTLKMMIRGQILFEVLEKSAETQDLKILARSYRRHLKYELESHLKSQPEQQIVESTRLTGGAHE